ncbi:MAG TPA: hypothetical protein VGM91_06125 [Conexibacter sp.]|jgi:hypothetical protein
MSLNVRRLATLAGVAVLGGAVSLANGAEPGGSHHAASSPGPAAAAAAPAPAVIAAARTIARAHVGALRHARRPGHDAIAASVASGPLLSGGLIDPATSREVVGGRSAAWVVSSSDGQSVCAVLRQGAAACSSVAALVDDGLSPGVMGRMGEPFHVFGVTADDVSEVVLVQTGGSRTSVSVTDNFFDVSADDWPASL